MTVLTFDQTRNGYANLWAAAQLRPERRETARAVARRIAANSARYGRAALGSMPWWWVGITHDLEAGGSFTRHLHNGDPLTARTTHVPAGRPLAGSPPFAWEDSARDALSMKNLGAVAEWSIPRALYEWERYNGFGYVARKVNSPYVWSFTNQYSQGKYVADGQFSPTAVSQQCGAAATLRALIELNLAGVVPAAVPSQAPQKTLDLDQPVPPIVAVPIRPAAPQWDIVGAVINLIRRIFS